LTTGLTLIVSKESRCGGCGGTLAPIKEWYDGMECTNCGLHAKDHSEDNPPTVREEELFELLGHGQKRRGQHKLK
jgi:hypothetical protein